jgi:hypothetical protein
MKSYFHRTENKKWKGCNHDNSPYIYRVPCMASLKTASRSIALVPLFTHLTSSSEIPFPIHIINTHKERWIGCPMIAFIAVHMREENSVLLRISLCRCTCLSPKPTCLFMCWSTYLTWILCCLGLELSTNSFLPDNKQAMQCDTQKNAVAEVWLTLSNSAKQYLLQC